MFIQNLFALAGKVDSLGNELELLLPAYVFEVAEEWRRLRSKDPLCQQLGIKGFIIFEL